MIRRAGFLAGSCLLLAGCPNDQPSVNPPVVPKTTATYFDRLSTYAAVLDNVTGANGNVHTVVLPAGIGYPPGTILIPGEAAVDACALDAADFLTPDPPVGWEPPVGSSSQFSFGLTVPAPVLAGLASVGANVNWGSTTSLDFEGMTLHLAYLSPFEAALASPACKSKIASALQQNKTVTVIRGSITGKESFTFNSNPGGSINVTPGAAATVLQGGSFNVTVAPNKVAIAMQEATPSVHFLIAYNIAPASVTPAPASVAAAVALTTTGAATGAPLQASPPPIPVRFQADPAVIKQLNPVAAVTPPAP